MCAKNMIKIVYILCIVFFLFVSCTKKSDKIVYGISPYQDTALPVVSEHQNMFARSGLDVDLVLLEWGDVMPSVASGAVDVAVQNFNSFQSVYTNITEGGGDILFYFPFYVFKGTAILCRDNDAFKTINDFLESYPNDRERAILETVKQFRGKHILLTEGTELEQIVLSALNIAGLDKNKDVKITHAQPADALNAFLSGEGDFCTAGVTERTEASRHNCSALIESSDLNPPVIDGLVTTKSFADSHQEELLKISKIWFETIAWMEEDLDERSMIIIDYLSEVSSTKFSIDEYKFTWFNTQVYPKNIDEVEKYILSKDAPYFWKNSWDKNNNYLIGEEKISNPIPYQAFWGEMILPTFKEVN